MSRGSQGVNQVGLRSPAFEFPRWAVTTGRARTNSEEPNFLPSLPTTPFETSSISTSSSPGKSGSILDERTGLPSPPGTNSDIALPVNQHDSLLVESPPATLLQSPKYLSRRTSSARSRPLSMVSSTSGSGLSDTRVSALKPNGGGIGRSASSSGSITHVPRHNGDQPPDPTSRSRRQSVELSRELSRSQSSHTSQRSSSILRPKISPIKRESLDLSRKNSISSSLSSHHSQLSTSSLRPQEASPVNTGPSERRDNPSPRPLHSSHGSKRSSSLRPKNSGTSNARRESTDLTRQYSTASSRDRQASPERPPSPLRQPSYTGSTSSSRHKSSPSVPVPGMAPSTSPTKRSSGLFTSSPSSSPQIEDGPSRLGTKTRKDRSGLEEDDRIRLMEEQVREATTRKPRPASAYPSTSPTRPVLRSRDSYNRASGATLVQQPHHDTDTMRRSATISSGSSMAQTPNGGTRDLDASVERSGGSGSSKKRQPFPAAFREGTNSLFTPSPKASPVEHQRNSLHLESPSAPMNRYSTTSRLTREQSIPSPSSKGYRSGIDGLERSSSVSSRLERRQWSESVSGLSRRAERIDDRGLPLPHSPLRDRRAETLANSELGSKRYSRDHDLSSRLSRLNIAPGDSVSAVGAGSERGTPSSTKNPLDLLNRIETERAESNRHWDAERSASVMADHPYPRPHSGSNFDRSPRTVRPATSMSSLHHHNPPRTAPVERIRKEYDDSPSYNRSASRLEQVAPSSEPRQVRSTTSLARQSHDNLNIDSASSEHGRLLYEAARTADAKIGHLDNVVHLGFTRTLNSVARSAETSNAAIRTALQHLNQMAIDAELYNDTAMSADDLRPLLVLLRDAGRMSDEGIRSLTSMLLDLPKVLREPEGSRMVASSTTSGSIRSFGTDEQGNRGSRRFPHSTYDSPTRRGDEMVRPVTSLDNVRSPESMRYRPHVPRAHEYDRSYVRAYPRSPLHTYDSPSRRSEDLPRPSTSLDYATSGERRRVRESLPPNFAIGEPSRSGGFMSKFRNFGKNKEELGTIEDSPPNATTHRVPESPLSPARHRLIKKASTISTQTVRGNSFLPSASKKADTVISAITAGDDDSPTTAVFDKRSIRSMRLYRDESAPAETAEGSSSPRSRLSSFHTAEEASRGSSFDGAEDDVLSSLVEAQRRREAEERDEDKGAKARENAKVTANGGGLGRSSSLASRPPRKFSISDTFRATLGR